MCLTPKLAAARKLALSYGIYAVHAAELKGDFSGPATLAAKALQEHDIASQEDRFVMTAGVPFGTPGSTNLLRVAQMKDELL